MLPELVLAGTTCFLAGVSWVVQLVVYPSFLRHGGGPGWAEAHAAHSRGMALLLALPWSLQGLAVAVLLLDPGPLVLVSAVLAAVPVLVTVLVSVPCHERLVPWDEAVALRLLRTHTWRTAAWTAGSVVSLLLLSGG